MTKPADYVIDNASGSDVRSDLNDVFEAIRQNNGYGSEPTQKYNYMWYANTSSDRMSFYKANAADRVEFISLADGNFFGPNGSASSPSYTFTNSTSTGFYRSASNEIGVSNNGTETALFKADGFNVKNFLNVVPASGEAHIQVQTNGVNNEEAYIDFVADTTYTDYGLRLVRGDNGPDTFSQLVHRGAGDLQIMAQDGGSIDFKLGVSASNANLARWRFRSSGAFVWAEHTASLATNTDTTGVIVPKGIASKTGSNAGATTSGNVYNFYWTGSALKCWIDQSDQGQVTITASDYRIKKNITTQTELGIDKIKQLRPVNYEYTDYGVFKGDGVAREGFVAHEVAEVIPSGVNDEKDGEAIQSLNLDAVVSVLTKALQEAVAKIETLETKVAALEAK